ncbi:MAG: transposase [Clostridia bacterium]|nr:transposase [Clostridia bacterium]
MMERRIHPRLTGYDYGRNGAYFVTICTKDRKPILGSIAVGRDAYIAPQTEMSEIGKTVDRYIKNVNSVYPNVFVDRYVIMPNHVHILFRIDADSGAMRAPRPTISSVVRSIKSLTTKKVGKSIWQTSFYDHIIRDERDFLTHWQYIDANPAKWAEDELYCGS